MIALASTEHRPRSIAARPLTADRYVDPEASTTDVLHDVVGFARERHGLTAS